MYAQGQKRYMVSVVPRLGLKAGTALQLNCDGVPAAPKQPYVKLRVSDSPKPRGTTLVYDA
jgi:hypothetical protein